MRKAKYYLLLAAMVISAALPASAKEMMPVSETRQIGESAYEERYEIAEDGTQINVATMAGESVDEAGKVITITNPNKPDTVGPVLKGFTVDKSVYYTNKADKNTMRITAKITDDMSGFNYGWVYFKNASGNSISVYVASYQYNKSTKKYEPYTTVGMGWVNGKYKFDHYELVDNAGNRSYKYATDADCPKGLKAIEFTIKTAKIDKKVTINSIGISPKSLVFKKGEASKLIKFSWNLTPNKGKITEVRLHFIEKEGNKGSSYYFFNTTKKNFATAIKNNDSWYDGTWFLNEVTVIFSDYDMVSLSKQNGKLGKEFQKKYYKIDAYKENPIPVGGDKSFPKIKDLNFTTTKYSLAANKDGQIKLKLNVSDTGSGVAYAYASFYSPEAGKSISASVNLKKNKKSGGVAITIPISRFISKGTYKLNYLQVKDGAGHTTIYVTNKEWYTDSKMTKYKDFTTGMSKTAIKMKNTSK